MSADLTFETLYAKIQLVRGGRGSRRAAQLCVMSFVALLAGEGHTDSPRTASPAIRNFAIALNDGMPAPFRQKLKPFAPRIIGTNEGRDFARIKILRIALERELLPRILRDSARWSSGPFSAKTDYAIQKHIELCQQLDVLMQSPDAQYDVLRSSSLVISVGRLICVSADLASTIHDREWYWCKALDLLDRLCDVGADFRGPSVSAARLSAIEEKLAPRFFAARGRQLGRQALKRIRAALPVF